MDVIQKKLEVFLEEKRTEFPRFYFISNDELLQLLAEQKEVAKVERHLNKLFDNVIKLFFAEGSTDDSDNIHGVVSSEGEELRLNKPTKKQNMGVELWLKSLKKEIKLTVNKMIGRAA
jgi:dynein heavy chain, axonemal